MRSSSAITSAICTGASASSGEVLLVALEGRPEDYTARLENLIASRRVGVTVLDAEDDSTSAAESTSAGGGNGAPHSHHHDH